MRGDSLNTKLTIISKKRKTILDQRKFEDCKDIERSNLFHIVKSATIYEKIHDVRNTHKNRNSAGRGN